MITSKQLAGGYAKEGDLVRACIDWLRTVGCVAWKQNQGGMKAEYQGRRRFIRFAHVAGISDVIGCTPTGRMVVVECKQPGNKPTPEQAAFLESIRAKGGIAIVAHDLDELAAEYHRQDNPGRSDK